MNADLTETIETLRLVATGSPSTALMLAMHTSILANFLIDPRHVPAPERAAFEQQRDQVWQQAVEGKFFAVANSEPGSGGDVHRSRATVRNGKLEGIKSFASAGTFADFYMATARDQHSVLDYYLVRNDPATVSIESPWDALGMRASESVTLRFSGTPVVGVLGYRGMLDGVSNRHWSTLSFTAIFVGAAEALLEEARQGAAGMLQQVETVNFHLTLQACRAFLRHCVAEEPQLADAAYRRLVRDCKVFVTRALAREATALFTAQSGRAYGFSSAYSRLFRDLMAGPALRPPMAMAFDDIWDDLGDISA